MADKGKGKIVNQWASFVIDEAGESVAAKLPISLTVGDGLFHIPVAKHICDFLGSSYEAEEGRGGRHFDAKEGEVFAPTIDGAKGAHKLVMGEFQARFRNANRTKKLIVEFRGEASNYQEFMDAMRDNNLPHMVTSSHMRHGKAPNLELSYQILWQMGDRLYRVYADRSDGGPPQMTYMMAVPGTPKPGWGKQTTFVLDWTEEREAFFAQMVAAMNTLVLRITLMLCGDTTANIDRMIASGGGLMALPAPEKADA
jgi:hypothetical protein